MPARALVTLVVAGSLLVPVARVRAQVVPAPTIDSCRDLKDEDVRGKIREMTADTLKRELAGVNYLQLVDKQWADRRIDERIDREIDDAVAAVSKDVGWIERAYSTVSRETAERFATAVAERAYNSAGFRAALVELAQGVGGELGARIESTAGTVASPILACVQTALSTRYGGAIAGVFARESEESARIQPQVGAARIDAGDLALEGAGTISGIVLVVTRRVIGRIVAGIGQRVAGLVASRVISTFTGIIGLALIARDLYDAGSGVFPIVAERMKSAEAKGLIKTEIVKSIEADMREQTTTIADETAERLYSFWLDFKQKYAKLLQLAEKNADFATFLKDRRIDQLGRLGLITELVLAQEGEPALFRRTSDGSLSRILLDLTDAGITIARERASIEDALAWAALAPGRLDKVVAFDLARSIAPADITAERVAVLLDLDDAAAIARLARLEKTARDALLAMPTEQLRDLARRMTETELDAFVTYQRRLDRTAAARVARAVAEDPTVMSRLSDIGLRDAILGSRDQLAAVEMLLRNNAALSIGRIGLDLEAVTNGAVHWRVFAQRYWVALIVLALLTLLILAWLRRLLFGGPRVVVVERKG